MSTALMCEPTPDPGPRERLWAQGPATLSDEELLAVLLGTGRPGASARVLAREILDDAGAVALLSASASHLARRRGVGVAKAARLVAAIELGRRALAAPLVPGAALSTPAQVAAIFGPRLAGLGEHFIVVHLDSRNRVLGESVIARGGPDRCPVPVRDVLAAALQRGAAGIICVHNHPSGDVEPSAEDRALTLRLGEACRLVGVHLLDHVVVGRSRFASLRERGWISSR